MSDSEMVFSVAVNVRSSPLPELATSNFPCLLGRDADEVAVHENFGVHADSFLYVVNFVELLLGIKFIENNLLHSIAVLSMTSKEHQAQMLHLSCIFKFCFESPPEFVEICFSHTVRVNVWVEDKLPVLAEVVRFQKACCTYSFFLIIGNRVQVIVVLFDSTVFHVVDSAV